MPNREDRIRDRAHALWLQEGQPSGHEQRHWEQALAEVDAEDAPAAKPAKKAPAPKKGRSPEKVGCYDQRRRSGCRQSVEGRQETSSEESGVKIGSSPVARRSLRRRACCVPSSAASRKA